MPPRDYDHNTVKIAIQKDRWKITHKPYRLKLVKVISVISTSATHPEA